MDVLKRHRRAIALVSAAVLVLCCSVGERKGSEEAGLWFSHKVHVQSEGLDCISCHATFDSKDDPGMPVKAQCMLCHADLDEEKPADRKVETLFDGDVYRARHESRLSEEVVFSHQAHAVDAELCGTCHEGIEENERLDARMAVPMDDCMKCHGNLNVANECSTCHSEISEDRAPATHAGTWERTHGMVFRAGSRSTANRCDLCHLASDCNDCHFNVPPDNHTNYWRRRGHGITARMDRQNCTACHRTDSCDACHREARPQSHGGMWGSPLNRHCLNCHLSAPAQTGCNLCHSGTPSHSRGAPQPPDHTPGMNCRQCHGVSAPLPHVVKGEDCTICHP